MIADGQHLQQTPRCGGADAIDPAAASIGNALGDKAGCYELRFQSLFDGGRGFAFPCDAVGQVDLDALSERARNNYFYARAAVGREFHTPTVLHVPLPWHITSHCGSSSSRSNVYPVRSRGKVAGRMASSGPV